MSSEPIDRAGLPGAPRVVVKVGSSSLTDPDGLLVPERLHALVDVLAERRRAGGEVLLVSSGAQAAGMGPLGLRTRPRDLATAQATASVGQGLLMAEYTGAFAMHGLRVGQVLLTAEDLIRRSHYRNAHRALTRLLAMGVVPVVNENDTVATDEIRFGDNDRLAALVAHLVHADALVLLTDVDALYDAPPTRPGARRIPLVRSPGELRTLEVTGRGSAVGTGGMLTKVQAATMAAAGGIPALVTGASLAGEALAGADVGTWFTPTGERAPIRRLWLAWAARTRGRITVDDGAARAVTERGTSLLPAGVVGVRGTFEVGDPIEIADERGKVIARALAGYSSAEVPDIMGRRTASLIKLLGPGYDREMTHRDEMVLIREEDALVRRAGPDGQ